MNHILWWIANNNKLLVRLLTVIALFVFAGFGYMTGQFALCESLGGKLIENNMCIESKCLEDITVIPCDYNHYLIIKEQMNQPFNFNLTNDRRTKDK